ncbi:MAG: flagellar motor switch protein FliM [Burkholderiaceae bacterium]
MADEFLSQDEVDALLSGTEDEEQAADADSEAAPPDPEAAAGKSYDLLNRERLISGHMPALEAAHDRFGRQLGNSISAFLRRPSEISVGTSKVQRYADFIDALKLPTSLTIVQINPLRGKGLMVCEPDLIFALIETMFGGAGKHSAEFEGREFSPTERSVANALVRLITETYRLAWQEAYPLSLDPVRTESQPKYAEVAGPDDAVVTFRCLIDVAGLSGAFHLCLPYTTLDPIRSTLYSTINKDQLNTDPVWTEKLSEQLEIAEIELVAKLANTELTFGELINLSAGDFIELDLAEQVEITVNDVPFLSCNYGTNQDHYAVKVDRFLTPADEVLHGVTHDGSE